MSAEGRLVRGRRGAGVTLAVLGLLLAAPPAAEAKRGHCPGGMLSIGGKYCIDAYEASVDVINSRGKVVRRHSPYHVPKPDQRLLARVRRGVVPQAYISQEQAADACRAAGKRLCSSQEWVAACKGKSPTVYPYGDEYKKGRCNDRGVSPLRVLHGRDDSLDTFGIEKMNDPKLNQIPGSLAKTGAFSRCRNSYGAYDMVGNLHEWTADPGGTFRGGYFLDVEQNGSGCNYRTSAHNTKYHDYSIGFRCCKGGDGATPSPPKASKVKASGRIHVVAAGDTLSGVAARYSVSVADICSLNDIDKRDPIHPDQELKIPTKR